MVPAAFFLRFGCTTAVVMAGGLLVACSSSVGNAPHPSTPGKPSSSSASTSSGLPATTKPPAKDPYPALCRKIDPRHAQALFTKPLAPMTTGGSSDCQFTPKGPVDDTDTL